VFILRGCLERDHGSLRSPKSCHKNCWGKGIRGYPSIPKTLILSLRNLGGKELETLAWDGWTRTINYFKPNPSNLMTRPTPLVTGHYCPWEEAGLQGTEFGFWVSWSTRFMRSLGCYWGSAIARLTRPKQSGTRPARSHRHRSFLSFQRPVHKGSKRPFWSCCAAPLGS